MTAGEKWRAHKANVRRGIGYTDDWGRHVVSVAEYEQYGGARELWGSLIECKCPVCGRMFRLEKSAYRQRLALSKSGVLYCSSRCVPHPTEGTTKVGSERVRDRTPRYWQYLRKS